MINSTCKGERAHLSVDGLCVKAGKGASINRSSHSPAWCATGGRGAGAGGRASGLACSRWRWRPWAGSQGGCRGGWMDEVDGLGGVVISACMPGHPCG